MIFEPQVIRFGRCVSAADALTGVALLALPPASEDVLDPFAQAVGIGTNQAELDAAIERLDLLGIEADAIEDGYEGVLSDGRQLIGLTMREPLMVSPSVADLVAAVAACRAALEAAAPSRRGEPTPA